MASRIRFSRVPISFETQSRRKSQETKQLDIFIFFCCRSERTNLLFLPASPSRIGGWNSIHMEFLRDYKDIDEPSEPLNFSKLKSVASKKRKSCEEPLTSADENGNTSKVSQVQADKQLSSKDSISSQQSLPKLPFGPHHLYFQLSTFRLSSLLFYLLLSYLFASSGSQDGRRKFRHLVSNSTTTLRPS